MTLYMYQSVVMVYKTSKETMLFVKLMYSITYVHVYCLRTIHVLDGSFISPLCMPG